MALPTSGAAWSNVVTWSNRTPDVNLSENNADGDVVTLAKALVYARTGDAAKRTEVIAALDRARSSSLARALELGRGFGAYVLAADLIGYQDPAFVSWVRLTVNRRLDRTQVECHEQRPNNWGTWCGASRVIADLYLADTTDLARAVTVWRGWLGDRAQYAGFSYGDLAWQCNAAQPVGINPECIKSGVDIGGVLPDDQRRNEDSPFPEISCASYVWEALQGTVLAGAVLDRAGYPFWAWSDAAVVRAYDWLAANGCEAEGDDRWSPWVVDHFGGTEYSSAGATQPGKGFGYADWLWP